MRRLHLVGYRFTHFYHRFIVSNIIERKTLLKGASLKSIPLLRYATVCLLSQSKLRRPELWFGECHLIIDTFEGDSRLAKERKLKDYNLRLVQEYHLDWNVQHCRWFSITSHVFPIRRGNLELRAHTHCIKGNVYRVKPVKMINVISPVSTANETKKKFIARAASGFTLSTRNVPFEHNFNFFSLQNAL